MCFFCFKFLCFNTFLFFKKIYVFLSKFSLGQRNETLYKKYISITHFLSFLRTIKLCVKKKTTKKLRKKSVLNKKNCSTNVIEASSHGKTKTSHRKCHIFYWLLVLQLLFYFYYFLLSTITAQKEWERSLLKKK